MSNSKSRKIYELWTDIQDLIGAVNLWPLNIRRLFWTKGVQHADRLILAAFVYFNGLNPEVFMEWAEFFGLCGDAEARREFLGVFKKFSEETGYNLYAYVVARNRYDYLDGTVQRYISSLVKFSPATAKMRVCVIMPITVTHGTRASFVSMQGHNFLQLTTL